MSLLSHRMLRGNTHIFHVPETSSSEELVHPLQRQALGFGAKEIYKNHRDLVERGKDKVRPVPGAADPEQHDGRYVRHDKVEEPLHGSGQRDVEPAQMRCSDIHDIDPAGGSLAKLKAHGIDVYHDQGDVAGLGHGLLG